MSILKRVGLFGGTFNPIHFGHLRTALETMEAFGLEQVYFIPASDPPHKGKKDLADETDRLAMLSRAIEQTPGFSILDIEMRRPGRSYTIDTVRALTRESPPSTGFFLMIGLDAFMELDTWKDYKRILETVPLIVIFRPYGKDPGKSHGEFEGIETHIRQTISAGFVFNREENAFTHESLKAIHIFPATPLGISATAIRELVRKGRSIRYLLPDSVASYIHDKRLYI